MPVVLVGIPLLIILTAFVAYALAALSRSFSGGFVGWLENTLLTAGTLFSIPLAAALRLTSWLTNKLGLHFAEVFGFAVQFLAGIGQWLRTTIDLALSWPQELFRLQQWLVWHEIPKLLKALPNVVSTVVHDVVKVVHVVEQKVVKFPKLAESVAHAALVKLIPFPLGQLWGAVGWLLHHLRAVIHAVEHAAGEVVHPGRLWKDVTVPFGRTIAQIRKRFRSLAWLGAFASASALVSAALVKMGLSWVRCKNVGKTGKAICRAPTKWLENLLLGTVAIFGTISLRVFAKEVYDLTRDAADQINRFWRNDLKATGANPGLGEIGGPKFLNTSTAYVAPNPGLGDVG